MIGTRNPFRGMFNTEAGTRCGRSRGGKAGADGIGSCVDLDAVEHSRFEAQPQAKRRHVNTLTECIERLDSDPSAIGLHISAEGEPAELRMINDVSRRIDGNPEKVRAVIAGIRIPAHILWEGMKRCAREAILIDVAEPTHRTGISDAQQVEVFRMA